MWIAASAPPSQDTQTAIILAIIGLLGLVLAALIGGVFTLMSARAKKTEPSPPSPVPVETVDVLGRERIRVLEFRADDSDQRDDLQDRAIHGHGDDLERHDDQLGQLQRWAKHTDPEWWDEHEQ